MGAKEGITTWQAAKDTLLATCAPQCSNKIVLVKLLEGGQTSEMAADTLITQKRALLAELTHQCTEALQLDMVYGQTSRASSRRLAG